jgi:hypothetical protein
MDIFDKARDKAETDLLEKVIADGYQKLTHPLGSLFHFVKHEGLPNKAIIVTFDIAPDIGFNYKFRRTDSLELIALLERNYNISCYHYSFDETLEGFQEDHIEVKSAMDILEFWESHGVSFEADKPEQPNPEEPDS